VLQVWGCSRAEDKLEQKCRKVKQGNKGVGLGSKKMLSYPKSIVRWPTED